MQVYKSYVFLQLLHLVWFKQIMKKQCKTQNLSEKILCTKIVNIVRSYVDTAWDGQKKRLIFKV